jgi:hypothetical protein
MPCRSSTLRSGTCACHPQTTSMCRYLAASTRHQQVSGSQEKQTSSSTGRGGYPMECILCLQQWHVLIKHMVMHCTSRATQSNRVATQWAHIPVILILGAAQPIVHPLLLLHLLLIMCQCAPRASNCQPQSRPALFCTLDAPVLVTEGMHV